MDREPALIAVYLQPDDKSWQRAYSGNHQESTKDGVPMLTQPMVQSVLITAAVVYFIVRQVTPRPPSRLRLYILPILAIYEAYQSLPRPEVPKIQLLECLLSILVAIVFGFLQARYTKVYQENGVWLLRGDWRYLVTWLLLLVGRLLVAWGFSAMFGESTMIEWILWTEVAVVWGTRSLLLLRRYPELIPALKRNRR